MFHCSRVAALALLVPLSFAAGERLPRADARRYIDDVKFLSSPELQGRGAGSEGLERAARYIADRFRSLGLKPAGDSGSWL